MENMQSVIDERRVSLNSHALLLFYDDGCDSTRLKSLQKRKVTGERDVTTGSKLVTHSDRCLVPLELRECEVHVIELSRRALIIHPFMKGQKKSTFPSSLTKVRYSETALIATKERKRRKEGKPALKKIISLDSNIQMSKEPQS